MIRRGAWGEVIMSSIGIAVKRATFGDVFEAPTSNGLGYFQYTHRHTAPPKMGSLIRVIKGLHGSRPTDICGLTEGPTLFVAFIPLQTCINRGIFERVGHCVIPETARIFPVFRVAPLELGVNGRFGSLWDGERKTQIKEWREDYKTIPILGTWNDTILISRISTQWTCDLDPRY